MSSSALRTAGHRKGAAGISIGLILTLIHLISIPVTNTSVNPARSTAVAFFHGNGAPEQLWLFWLAPIIGALISGATYRYITAEPVAVTEARPEISGEARV